MTAEQSGRCLHYAGSAIMSMAPHGHSAAQLPQPVQRS